MLFVKFFVLTLAIYGVLCEEDNEENSDNTELRESREYGVEAWRGLDNEKIYSNGWIPHDRSTDIPQEIPIIKRRRLRKRKRRPSQPSVVDVHAEDTVDRIVYLPRRRLRPLRLGQADDDWADMEQENPKRPANRRRIVPAYSSEETRPSEPQLDIITEKEMNISPIEAMIHFADTSAETVKPKTHEKIRDPFVALKEAEEKQKTPEEIKQTTTSPNLKELLKKTGGTISLSEILQKRNLSLSELLTGNVKAISVLTESSESTEITEPSIPSETKKYNRVLPSERKKMSSIVEPPRNTAGNVTSEEVLKAQKKRVSLLQNHKEHVIRKVTSNTYETVTQPVTERRIFVPSHPKHYSMTNFKQVLQQNSEKTVTPELKVNNNISKFIEEDNEVNLESSNTVIPPKPSKILPVTTEKLITKSTANKPTFSKRLEDPIPSKFAIYRKEETVVDDEPFKISLDLDMPFKTVDDSDKHSEENLSEVSNEKLDIITAREEILDMLKDPIYRERLSRILQQRNMTIDELVDQRERGSSQLHLADIFHNKTREPEPIEEPYVGIIKNDIPNNFREQKSMKLGKEDSKQAQTSIPKPNTNFKISLESKQEEKLHVSTTEEYINKKMFGLNSSFDLAAVIPFWKQYHPELFNQFYQNDDIKSWKDIRRIEEVDNRLSDVITDKLGVEARPKNYHLDEETLFDIPTGIKSALVASFAIVGLSLVMFITILIIFKWAQRTKNKLNYTSSLSGKKIKSPILEIPQRSALKSFVCETLGRRTNFYKSQLQSMSDVWDDRKKQRF